MNAVLRESTQPNRLPAGGRIDRNRPLRFSFDGKVYRGFAGDTLASALLAEGVTLVGRSFKYHRPRGVLAAGSEEPNALVELRTGSRREPNTRATVAELYDGLEARSQNRWPSLGFDIAAINSLLSPMFVAGFYYKTFMWPASWWEKLYEPAIRRAAGLGRATTEPDPDTYQKAHAFCDVLVIGGGPAGLSAALAAARAGACVILCDEDFVLGGRLNGERREVDGMSGSEWARRVEAELESMPEVRLMRRTTVFGTYDHGTFGAIERVTDHLLVSPPHVPRQRLWRIVAKRVVLAAGAIERPLVFGGNDRPGVMLASAVRTYLHRYAVAPTTRAVVFTTTDDGWKTALDLASAGVQVEALVDARPQVADQLTAAAKRARLHVLTDAHIVETHGSRRIRSVTVRERSGTLQHLPADLLAMSGGWNPNVALSTHLGVRSVWSPEKSAFLPSSDLRAMTAVGAARGSFALAQALREGSAAGAEAAQSTGFRAPAAGIPACDDELTAGIGLWHPRPSKTKSFVDFQHDVTTDDVALAAREGYKSVELLKRYTTLGMGTDQGKTSNSNGLAILASLTHRSIPEVGTTVFRPPYTPVTLGAFAGHSRAKAFRPTRLPAAHEWAVERGATFVEVGQWLRAQMFATPGETDCLQTVAREVKAVRSSVGVCDVSTLGKIDVQGPDAAAFLDRVYTNMMSTLAIGKVRYGLMLREDGFVLDDGTSARFAADHFVVSTTTANAGRVMQHLEYVHQVLCPELDVQIASVTEQWAQYTIAGPNARRLLQELLSTAIDISNEAFPYQACAAFTWRGIAARLFRVSFSGELSYELAVPASYGDATVREIMSAGARWGIVPYGTEALTVMRVEKGHVAGNELNGTTTAADLGLGRMFSKQKSCVGGVLAARPALVDPDRPCLVGFKPVKADARLYAGAHFLAHGAKVKLANDQGYMTSTAYSPTLGHWIGLGLLGRGPQRIGERMRAYDPVRSGEIEVEVVSPVFVDPEGLRLRS